MKPRTLETIVMLVWLVLWPFVATWLVSQGKTSALLLGVALTAATWRWVIKWVERPWGAQAEVWEPLSMAGRLPLVAEHVDMVHRQGYSAHARTSHIHGEVAWSARLVERALKERDDDDDA